MDEDRYSNLEVSKNPTNENVSPKYFVVDHEQQLPEVLNVANTRLNGDSHLPEPVSSVGQLDEGQKCQLKASNDRRSSRRKFMVWGIAIGVILVAAVIGGILGGVLSKRPANSTQSTANVSPSSTSSSSSAAPTMFGTAAAAILRPYPTAASLGYPDMEVFALENEIETVWKYKNLSASGSISWSPSSDATNLMSGITAPIQYGITATTRGTQIVDLFILGEDYSCWYGTHSTDSAWNGWMPLGSNFTTAPSVVSWGPQRLDIFAVATGPLYHISQLSFNGSAWSDWNSHPGPILATYPPAVTSWGAGRLDIFALGASDRSLYHRFYDGAQWSPIDSFTDLGGYCTSKPAAISVQVGRIDVFVRGGDAGLWHLTFSNNSTWSNWTSISGGVIIQEEPCTVTWDSSRIDVFVRAADNSLQHKWLDVPTAKWSPAQGFEKLRDGIDGPPTAVSDGTGSLHVFVYLQSGALGHLSWNESLKSWSPAQGFELLGHGNWTGNGL